MWGVGATRVLRCEGDASKDFTSESNSKLVWCFWGCLGHLQPSAPRGQHIQAAFVSVQCWIASVTVRSGLMHVCARCVAKMELGCLPTPTQIRGLRNKPQSCLSNSAPRVNQSNLLNSIDSQANPDSMRILQKP